MSELFSYRVRAGFHLHLVGGGIHSPGAILKLTPEQFALYSHQLEPYEEPENDSPRQNRTRKPRTSPSGVDDGDN